MTDAVLEAKLFADAGTKQGHRRQVEPDWASIHRELKRKHVTLAILWDEYVERNPEGYRYSRFCELYRSWEGKLSVTMRQTHVGAARDLDRALFQKLATCGWIDAHENLILCGPTGIGKSWLASALGHKACRDNRSVLYQRIPKLVADLALARGDGRYARLLRALGGVQLLILDDWGLEPLDAAARHDFLEILEERYGRRSTIITSQIPVDKWHGLIGDPTYADAILDRIVHNAQRINLTGHSLRRVRVNKTSKEGVPT
jgi:DNA replication protein DnaC